MSNFRSTLASWVVFLSLVLLTGCIRKTVISPLGCVGNAEKVTESAAKYVNDPSKANCEAYKKTIVDFFKSCPTFYTGVTKKDLDDFVAEPCD